MKLSISEKFRDPDLVRSLVEELQSWEKPVKLMEVCGSHTMAIGHWGLRKLLPSSITLLSGPGCPVCVTPYSVIDSIMNLKDVTIATFGDLIRVPGRNGSLEQSRARGLDVRIVYSPFDALEMAKKKETVFIGIGFETTSPGVAYTIKQAAEKKIKNFSVLPAFKIIPPALEALADDKDVSIDAFILPGHVSAILGSEPYRVLSEKYETGGVVTGFEPLDILNGIRMLLRQIQEKDPRIEIEYKWVVHKDGNPQAKAILDEIFTVEDSLWRGIGKINRSGLTIRDEFSDYNALKKYNLTLPEKDDFDKGCRCGDVLKGKIIPKECPLFKVKCTPENPIGACMVSSEGSCAAYYKYEE